MLEWGTIILSAIVSLLSAGGLGWIITAREDKKAKALDNKEKEIDIKEKEKDDVIQDWKDIAEERKNRCDELKNDLREKDDKLTQKDEIISELKTKLDARNTYCAVAELLRCEDTACPNRKPPFGTREVRVQDNFDTSV